MSNNSANIEEIWEVFSEEGRENLDQAESYLLQLEDEAASSQDIAALFRAIHTLKGSSRMMGLVSLETLAHRAEDLISMARNEEISLTSQMISLLLAVLDCCRSMLADALARRADVSAPEADKLIQQLQQAGKPAAKPLTPTEEASQPVSISTFEEQTVSVPEMPVEFPETEEQIEIIDLASDPTSVRIFFEMVDEEIKKVQAYLSSESLEGQDPSEVLETAAKAIDELQYAASQMGYADLEIALSALTLSIQNDPHKREAHTTLYHIVETELIRIHQRYEKAEETALPGEPSPLTEPGECSILSDSTSEAQFASGFEANGPESTASSLDAGNHLNLNSDTLKQILDLIGTMVGDQAALHRTTSQINQNDLYKVFEKQSASHNTSVAQVQSALEPILAQWADDISAIQRVENKISTTLNQLHEMIQSLYLTDAYEGISSLRSTIIDLGTKIGKPIDVQINGEKLMLDHFTLETLKVTIQLLADILIRSSIETPEERQLAGKQPAGQLEITMKNMGGNLQVVVYEDGKGLKNPQELSEIQTLVKRMKGTFSFQINSQGSCYWIGAPLQQSIVEGMVVRVGNTRYLISVQLIRRILHRDQAALFSSSAENNQAFIRVEEQIYPIYELTSISAEGIPPLLIIIEAGKKSFALAVDEVIRQENAMTLPLPHHLKGIQSASGCVILEDGEVGMVFDPNALLSTK